MYVGVITIGFQELGSSLYLCIFNVLVVLPVGLDKRRSLYRVKYWDTTESLRIYFVCWCIGFIYFIFPLDSCIVAIRILDLLNLLQNKKPLNVFLCFSHSSN